MLKQNAYSKQKAKKNKKEDLQLQDFLSCLFSFCSCVKSVGTKKSYERHKRTGHQREVNEFYLARIRAKSNTVKSKRRYNRKKSLIKT